MGPLSGRGGGGAQDSFPLSGARDHPADALRAARRDGDYMFEIYGFS
jgi:hypothetical protein